MAAYQVTLTSAATNYSLLALVRAIDSTFVDRGAELTILADVNNSDQVLVGDSSLSTSRYGHSWAGGEGKQYNGKAAALRGRYARSASATQKVNIEVSR